MPNMVVMQQHRWFSTPDKNSSKNPTTGDQPSYIKEMQSDKDWQNALENRERPVLIQAGASWCGPCNMIKPMLIDAVKELEGKIEYLYVDIDKHKKIAELLRVSDSRM